MDSSNTPHYQIIFFSASERFIRIPDVTISVPEKATADNLNTILNKTLENSSDEEWKPVDFDFLIDSVLLRTTLAEFAQEHGTTMESVIRVECILRQPQPTPDYDILLEDWVADVKTTDQFIAAATYDGKVSLYSHSGEVLSSLNFHDGSSKCIDVISAESGCRIVSGGSDQKIVVSDVLDKASAMTPTLVLRGHERGVECVAANKEGTRLISGGFDAMLKVWNIEKGDESTIFAKGANVRSKRKMVYLTTRVPMVTLAGHKEAVVGATWLPWSKKDVITVSWDHTILIWDLELAGHTSSLSSTKSFTCVATCPSNGLILTGSVDPIVRLWDPRSREGSFVKESFFGHNGWVSSLCWNPTKEHLFVSCSFDKVSKMWDVRCPKTPLFDLKGHSDRIMCCDWSIGELIVSGGVDCTMKTFRTNE